MAYLKFRLDVPGTPVSAVLRLHNSTNPSRDAGNICLVTEPWNEASVTYNTRPGIGEILAKVGAVAEGQSVECPLELDLTKMKDVNLAIDPTTADATRFHSREGKNPAELVVEYAPEK